PLHLHIGHVDGPEVSEVAAVFEQPTVAIGGAQEVLPPGVGDPVHRREALHEADAQQGLAPERAGGAKGDRGLERGLVELLEKTQVALTEVEQGVATRASRALGLVGNQDGYWSAAGGAAQA